MATLRIRNVPTRVIDGLTALARRRNVSVEQEVRDLLEDRVLARNSLLRQLEDSWSRQQRRPAAEEIDRWIHAGRE